MVEEIDITEILVKLDIKNFLIVLEWLKDEGYTDFDFDGYNASVTVYKKKGKTNLVGR